MYRRSIAVSSMLASVFLWQASASDAASLPGQEVKPNPATSGASQSRCRRIEIRAGSEPEWFKGAFRPNEPGLEPPIAVKMGKPYYPIDAMAAQVTGEVHLDARVDADGKVRNAQVVCSILPLDASAIDAAKRFEFQPARQNGEAVAIIVRIILEFNLKKK